MKNIIYKIALGLFATFFVAQNSATAQSQRFSRSGNTLINFQVGQLSAGAKVIIRNSAGQVVRTKTFFTRYCNIESMIFPAGVYSYTIVNGGQSAAGSFSIQ